MLTKKRGKRKSTSLPHLSISSIIKIPTGSPEFLICSAWADLEECRFIQLRIGVDASVNTHGECLNRPPYNALYGYCKQIPENSCLIRNDDHIFRLVSNKILSLPHLSTVIDSKGPIGRSAKPLPRGTRQLLVSTPIRPISVALENNLSKDQ